MVIVNVSTVGVRKITNLWKFELNRSSKLRANNERKKHPCHTKPCDFRCLISRPQNLTIWGLEIKFVENCFLLENYITLEGVFLTMFYKQLPITRCQGRFYANNCFWVIYLPIVSTALKCYCYNFDWGILLVRNFTSKICF